GLDEQSAALDQYFSRLGALDDWLDGTGDAGDQLPHRAPGLSRSRQRQRDAAGGDADRQRGHLRQRPHQHPAGRGARGAVRGLCDADFSGLRGTTKSLTSPIMLVYFLIWNFVAEIQLRNSELFLNSSNAFFGRQNITLIF